MKKSGKVGLAAGLAGALGTAIGFGFRYVYKKGRRDGAKNREKEILIDYVSNIPLGKISEFAWELLENGVSEDYPMLVIRSDKYDYLDETDPDEVC